jgi:hypothetical protein
LIRKDFARFAAVLILALKLFSTLLPDAVFAASSESLRQDAPKSEAAEAWDAVKDTKNLSVLEAFIKRYRTTFFADLAKARIGELKATTTKTPAAQPAWPMPPDGVHEQAKLYEEDPPSEGQQSVGSVVWSIESVKVAGEPDDLAAHADIDIPSRGLRVTMSLRQNRDSSLQASHVVHLTFVASANFGTSLSNVPGLLMKSSPETRGMPLAGLPTKVNDGYFLFGLSSVAIDRERNLKKLREGRWIDIPIVYSNQQRAILAIDKGRIGEKVLKTVLTAWGEYPEATEPVPERDGSIGNAR